MIFPAKLRRAVASNLDTNWEYKGIIPKWTFVDSSSGIFNCHVWFPEVMTQHYDHIHGRSPITTHGLGPCWGYISFLDRPKYRTHEILLISWTFPKILPNRALEDWFPLYLAVFRVYVYVNLWDGNTSWNPVNILEIQFLYHDHDNISTIPVISLNDRFPKSWGYPKIIQVIGNYQSETYGLEYPYFKKSPHTWISHIVALCS